MTENTQLAVILPPEVDAIASQVTPEKRQEVTKAITDVMVRVNDWKKQSDELVIKDHTDIEAMQAADQARLEVKAARTKIFDPIFKAKREEIQFQKRDYDLIDKLWLKAQQVSEIMLKDIEKTLEYKANTAERYNHELKAKLKESRETELKQWVENTMFYNLSDMSEEQFQQLLESSKIAYENKLKADELAEKERLQKIETDRIEQEHIRKENEKLRAEKVEYDRLAAIAEQKYKAELAIQRKEAEAARLTQELETRKAQAEANRLTSELKAKQQAEAAELAKLDQERKEKEATERKAAKAPDKQKLMNWELLSLEIIAPELKSKESQDVAHEIIVKFNAFKLWATNKINEL
jgi:hypothetical protein